jgi:hypothetical protein
MVGTPVDFVTIGAGSAPSVTMVTASYYANVPSGNFVPTTASWQISGYDQPIVGVSFHAYYTYPSSPIATSLGAFNAQITVRSQNASKTAAELFPAVFIGLNGMNPSSGSPSAQITCSGAIVYETIPNPLSQQNIDISPPDNLHEGMLYESFLAHADAMRIPVFCGRKAHEQFLAEEVPKLVALQSLVEKPASHAAARAAAAASRSYGGFLDFLSKALPAIGSLVPIPGVQLASHIGGALLDPQTYKNQAAAVTRAAASAKAAARAAVADIQSAAASASRHIRSAAAEGLVLRTYKNDRPFGKTDKTGSYDGKNYDLIVGGRKIHKPHVVPTPAAPTAAARSRSRA